jgi:hypothetical protein
VRRIVMFELIETRSSDRQGVRAQARSCYQESGRWNAEHYSQQCHSSDRPEFFCQLSILAHPMVRALASCTGSICRAAIPTKRDEDQSSERAAAAGLGSCARASAYLRNRLK